MLPTNFWPQPHSLIDLSGVFQFADGKARIANFALCNDQGEPARYFLQGQRAHFFYAVDVHSDVAVPAGGIEIVTEAGEVLHGKNTFQHASPAPRRVSGGSRIRFHHWIDLEVLPGDYRFNIGFAGTDPDSYEAYVNGSLTHLEFASRISEHCRVLSAGSLAVGYAPSGKLHHHGWANLPGGAALDVLAGDVVAPTATALGNEGLTGPPIFHITHQKAGSQWIYNILRACVPDRIIEPQLGAAQVRHYAIQNGYVYPTVYLAKPEFDRIGLPAGFRHFVVIRDLRDTLVSAYFSFKISHPLLGDGQRQLRQTLAQTGPEEGMLYLLDHFLQDCARFQLSWIEAGEPVLRYEDLLRDDVRLLEETLIDRCRLPVSPETLRQAVLANRFEALTRGRPRGSEDVSAHERKGVAGDWRNHFTERIKSAFKARYGGVLVAAQYESDLCW